MRFSTSNHLHINDHLKAHLRYTFGVQILPKDFRHDSNPPFRGRESSTLTTLPSASPRQVFLLSQRPFLFQICFCSHNNSTCLFCTKGNRIRNTTVFVSTLASIAEDTDLTIHCVAFGTPRPNPWNRPMRAEYRIPNSWGCHSYPGFVWRLGVHY